MPTLKQKVALVLICIAPSAPLICKESHNSLKGVKKQVEMGISTFLAGQVLLIFQGLF